MSDHVYTTDTSSGAIKRSLQRLAATRHTLQTPPARIRHVQINANPEQQEEKVRDYMHTAVFTVFYGTTPQLNQFKEFVDSNWTNRDWIQVIEVLSLTHHAEFTQSDHLPITLVLQLSETFQPPPQHYRTYYKVDQALLHDPQIKANLEAVWDDFQMGEHTMPRYLASCETQLRILKQEQRRLDSHLHQLPALEAELAELHLSFDGSNSHAEALQQLTLRVKQLRAQQAAKLRTWARCRHIREGDAPTAYFLRRHRRRVARNKVRSLEAYIRDAQ
ncbi:hypothetical protein R1sor_010805 [Riccia sorocarpa]|uniref:Uncharacterized protein n=1 Tax=Riccia sorocarpa TaxID=122646 RepID=A0ABD3I0Z0_9MARC